MKRTFLILLGILAITIARAQSGTDEVKLFQTMFGMEKKAIVEQFIQLPAPQSATFWGLYDQFEADRQTLGLARIDLLQAYAANYATLDDVKTNALMKDMIELGQKNDKLIVTYYKKIQKEVGAKPAAQFFQLESYFLTAIRAAILDEIPFIGELDAKADANTKK